MSDEEESNGTGLYAYSDTLGSLAGQLIPNYHPELVTARIAYLFLDKAVKSGSQLIGGKAYKVSGKWEFMTNLDFVIEVSLPYWREASEEKRTAIMDHLLEYCSAEEQEDGSMKWLVRKPDLVEFSTVVGRNGAWNDAVENFVTLAQDLDVGNIIDSVVGETDLTVDE